MEAAKTRARRNKKAIVIRTVSFVPETRNYTMIKVTTTASVLTDIMLLLLDWAYYDYYDYDDCEEGLPWEEVPVGLSVPRD
ncbi:hypothetical protein E2C01_071611 [Portunus trituberculatus]|uniref:Uncharacterized protein n=1 Tax=Portunus trituberculatus TaxID=210409 RepID=A0A5B7I8N8_PORTR|nr:hypothetical protein [Portunus trituberculatus]